MTHPRAPLPHRDPTWIPVEPFPALGNRRSFISGEPEGDRLRVAYFHAPGSPHLFAKAWFGPGAEGPPGTAHGGSVMGVLDEVMGAACWHQGLPVVLARLTSNFRHKIPLGLDTTCEGWVEQVDGRKVTARARMYDAADRVLAEAEGLFIVLKPEQLRAFNDHARSRTE